MRTTTLAFVCALAVALLAAGVWYFKTPDSAPLSAAVALPAAPAAARAAPAAPARCGQSDGASCVEFRSTQYHFAIFHSDQKEVKTYDEGGGAATFTFENFDTAHGFQIFVVPYAGTQISDQRFKKDEPSGVREDLTSVTVGGVPAAAFYSHDPNLGDTYEVWFIHGGYLYEITTLKALESNMQERLATWEFI
jgi:hypothetical protein